MARHAKYRINNDVFEGVRRIMRERVLQAFGENVDEERAELQEVADHVQGLILTDVIKSIGQDATPKELTHSGLSWRKLTEMWFDRKQRAFKRDSMLNSLRRGDQAFFLGETGRTLKDLKSWDTQRAWGRPAVYLSGNGKGDLRKGFFYDKAGRIQRRVTLANGYQSQRFASRNDAFEALLEIDLFPNLGPDRRDMYKHLGARTASVLAVLDQKRNRPLIEPFMRYKNEVDLPRLVKLAIRA